MDKHGDVSTPALLLDADALDRNVTRMSDRIAALGVSLRAHMKTAKSTDVLDRIRFAGPRKIAVSTLKEADYFHRAGVGDVCYATPLAPSKVEDALSLKENGVGLSVFVNSAATAAALAETSFRPDDPIDAFIEIDADGYRSGVAPVGETFKDIALRLAAAEGVRLRGVYNFAGRTYDARSAAEGAEIVENCRRALLDAIERLSVLGIDAGSVTIGGSPVAAYAERLDGVDELCAGVWMFQDIFQLGLGVCEPEDLAVSVLASVIDANAASGKVFIDAGALALSQDRSTGSQECDAGFGLIADPDSGDIIDGYLVAAVSQEIGHVVGLDGRNAIERFPVGARIRVLPNHVCMTAAAYDGYHIVRGGLSPEAYWERINGW